MSCVKFRPLIVIGLGALVVTAARLSADSGSAGPRAESCGVPSGAAPGKTGNGPGLPRFPPNEYPVKLPAMSLLGARTDLPSPYRSGMSGGQLPEGRKWGSTASISIAPDGKLWVTDRCGASGSGAILML